MLRTSVVSPSQQRPPARFSSLPSATSSIRASRIGARPPAAASALARTSMQPPAAAAVRDRGWLTRGNGYSCAKKYTKAGTRSFSGPLPVRSSAICDTSA